MRGFLIAVCLVAACGGDDGSGGPYVPIDQIQQAFKTAECKHLVMCGEFATQDACVAANINVTYTISADAIAAVLAGRMYYAGDKVAACFDKIATETCDTTDADGRFDLDCALGPFRGSQRAGQPCAFDAECVSTVCNGGGGGQNCTQGTCVGDTAPVQQPPAPIGQHCASGTGGANSCVSGAYCDFQTTTCLALKTSGMTCNTASECDYGLGCVGNTTRTCKPLPTVGQPCPDFTCRDEGVVCNSMQVCAQVALPGASCTNATCSQYYTCDFATTMKCIAYPSVGQSCASLGRCNDANTFCDNSVTPQLCTALKAAGATCTTSQQCASNFCDTVNGNVCAVTPTCE